MWRKTHTIFRWCRLEVVGQNWRLMYRNLLFPKSLPWRSNLINYPPLLFNLLISKGISGCGCFPFFFPGNSRLAFCFFLFFSRLMGESWACWMKCKMYHKSNHCFVKYITPYIQTPSEEVFEFESLNISWGKAEIGVPNTLSQAMWRILDVQACYCISYHKY